MAGDLMVEGGKGLRVTKTGSLVSSDVPLVRSNLRLCLISDCDNSANRCIGFSQKWE